MRSKENYLYKVEDVLRLKENLTLVKIIKSEQGAIHSHYELVESKDTGTIIGIHFGEEECAKLKEWLNNDN